MRRIQHVLRRVRNRFGSIFGRGAGFWVGTVLLGLVLPVPVAVVAVTARLRARSRCGSLPPGRP